MNTYEKLAASLVSELSVALRAVKPEELSALKAAILQSQRIFVTGKGRSGLQMRGFAMRLMHLGLKVYVVDDVTTPSISTGDLLVIGTGSGRTPSLVNYAERAKALKAQLAVLTIDPTSPVARHADLIVRIAASTPKLGVSTGAESRQPMGSLFEQVLMLLLDVLVAQLMADLNMTSEQMFMHHANLE